MAYMVPPLPYGYHAWEHAYYLTYANRRSVSLEASWNVDGWGTVAPRYDAALSSIRPPTP